MKKVKPREDTCKRLCKEILDLKAEIEALRVEIEDRKIIEKAKWVLVKRKGIDEEEAHRILIESSQQEHRRLKEVALSLLAGDKLLDQDVNKNLLSGITRKDKEKTGASSSTPPPDNIINILKRG